MEKKVKLLVFLILMTTLSSCIPNEVKQKLVEEMKSGQQILADQEFKKAVAYIELHKIRNGSYPDKLIDLEYLTVMDSSMFSFVEYKLLDTVYELNIDYKIISIANLDSTEKVQLKYPEGFWKGLGCINSNVK